MYVCICNRVTEENIQKALSESRDIESLNVGKQCGKCISLAREIVEEYKKNNNG